ncbi:MAG: hypothetical protein V4662_23040 [Verrucomicrobiota bacterium]
MKPYKDTDGNSGISAYRCGDGWIRVRFKEGGTYEYRAAEIGAAHLKAMKRLAEAGKGLTTYINANSRVRDGYSRRW